jgi:hypothetical protein
VIDVLLEECNLIAVLWINGEVGVLVDVEGGLVGTSDWHCGDEVSNCVQCGPDMTGCSVDGCANLILQLLAIKLEITPCGEHAESCHDKFSW